jgi:hypothetical protein
MTPAWEPPGGPGRTVGGLLGVIAGETWRSTPSAGLAHVDPGEIGRATLTLCNSYVANRGTKVPVAVVAEHRSSIPPAWLLPVAIVRQGAVHRCQETMELAVAGGAHRGQIIWCVQYVELASRLLAGWPAAEAIRATTTEAVTTHPRPEASSDPLLDALRVGVWMLQQTGPVTDLLERLSGRVPPSVRAAALGLWGLRSGPDALPGVWHRCLPHAEECRLLAPALLRARTTGHAPAGLASPATAGVVEG